MKKFLSLIIVLTAIIAPGNLTAQDSQSYADYLKSNAENPVSFVLSKLKDYRIVAIGEDHWIADHTPFLCEVLHESVKHDETRPQVLALEFGNEIDQRTADNVTRASVFMPDSVNKILQHAPDVFGNPFREYFDLFKCVWEINRTLPTDQRIRILLLDPAGVQDYFDKIPSTRSRDRDMAMFNKLRSQYVKGRKILFYAGQAHTQRQIRGYKLNSRSYYYNYPSAGYLIKSSYPNDVYTIDLWAPLNMGQGYEVNPQTGRWYEKSNGLFDRAFELNGNKPCGFDIHDSIWGNITMADYFCPPGKEDERYPSDPKDGNPYTKDIKLSQLVDGLVFVKPVNEFSGGSLIDIYTPDFIEVCRRRANTNFENAESVLRQLHEWHPLMKMPK